MLMPFLGHLFISALALLFTSAIIPGFKIKGFFSAVIAALVVGILNGLLRPILLLLTLPINVLTLGLFTFVVNAIILRVAAAALKGFDIEGWFSAIIGALVLALANSMLFYFLGPSLT